ncbi:right-handed parallel beta-helix repeat-containing protein [Paraconexibacter antarcticus]|uniref:Right-handed parallel beta-helix repeat-containing protein n=1 Tax=Paraconexibacter antarcticus TaxID=2949664 RepID=A0ABY5DN33_9ACTN|nr:right-handed parallel beta-helix repeat-containing protein [Paraconexibacter antarcticus]UTI62845.1 right-handed parallel beta-helix repeat-containing protein [Paraconexibacter antarcticus]
MRRLLVVLVVLAVAAVLPTTAVAHPERGTSFPSVDLKPPAPGGIPVARSSGPSVVVCKASSKAKLVHEFRGNRRLLKSRLKTLRRCRFHDIQAAVNAAKSNYRVLIMPGVYEEMPSRMVPTGTYKDGSTCGNDYVVTEGFGNDAPPPVGPRSNDPPVRPDRNLQTTCPNAKNLIEVIGDPTHEADPLHPSLPKCLQKCNLQIVGLGKRAGDVLIRGDRKKSDVLRVDRAWGIYLAHFTVEQSAFNNLDLVEVNGFQIHDVVARYGQDYGILSFTSTNGLYDHVTAYGNGDSGIYPGSTEKGCNTNPNAYGTCGALVGTAAANGTGNRGCAFYSIEIRHSDSYGNTLGYSGTAGNSTWVHDNDFHDNATGLSTDSFAAGHPGMPQECVKWERNRIHSNNVNFFETAKQKYCGATPFVLRPRTMVCPQFQVPVGTGIIIAGGNRNLIRDNDIYDNWRQGILLFAVPAALRGDLDPAHQLDTSNGNRFIDNLMGAGSDGTRMPNGRDFTWDSEGSGNCFDGNRLRSGAGHQSMPAILPGCPGSPIVMPTNLAVLAPMISCAAWDPKNMPSPPGCDWFTTPRKPA